jgi:hypothetical protein
MNPYPHATPMPAPVPPRRPSWLVPVIIAAALVLVAGIAAVAVTAWALTRGNSPGRAAAATSRAGHVLDPRLAPARRRDLAHVQVRHSVRG